MGDTTGDSESLYGGGAVIVVTVVEVWVQPDGFNLCLSKRDLLRCGVPTACDNTYPCHTSWVHCCPFKCAPATHGTAYYPVEPVALQDMSECGFGIDVVPHGN